MDTALVGVIPTLASFCWNFEIWSCSCVYVAVISVFGLPGTITAVFGFVAEIDVGRVDILDFKAFLFFFFFFLVTGIDSEFGSFLS